MPSGFCPSTVPKGNSPNKLKAGVGNVKGRQGQRAHVRSAHVHGPLPPPKKKHLKQPQEALAHHLPHHKNIGGEPYDAADVSPEPAWTTASGQRSPIFLGLDQMRKPTSAKLQVFGNCVCVYFWTYTPPLPFAELSAVASGVAHHLDRC